MRQTASSPRSRIRGSEIDPDALTAMRDAGKRTAGRERPTNSSSSRSPNAMLRRPPTHGRARHDDDEPVNAEGEGLESLAASRVGGHQHADIALALPYGRSYLVTEAFLQCDIDAGTALAWSLVSAGTLDLGTGLYSLLALVPALAGNDCGQHLLRVMRPETFRRWFFSGLALLGRTWPSQFFGEQR